MKHIEEFNESIKSYILAKYDELVSIVKNQIDNRALNVIQEEAYKLTDNYYINIRLITYVECDESTYERYKDLLQSEKISNDGKVTITLYSGDIQYNNKGKKYEMLGTNTTRDKVTLHPKSIEGPLNHQNIISQLDPKMGYTITVGYKYGNSHRLDMEKTKEIGEKAFGSKYKRYDGTYNPEMVHEWRMI